MNYQFDLDNLNNTNQYSIVDFRIPNTNIYLELKSRTCKSNAFLTTYFDKSKVDRWNNSKHFKKAIIYIYILCLLLPMISTTSSDTQNPNFKISKLDLIKNGTKPVLIYH